jgi:hypothetical protein
MNPEECDDGNNNTNDGCPDGLSGSCKLAFCGDGYVNSAAQEICDSLGDVGCPDATPTCQATGVDRCKKCL